jgi:Phasin protein
MDREKSVQQTTAMQKELLGAWQQANRYWADRMQSEMALWADFGSKLVSTRSVPEAFEAYAKCLSQQMKMTVEDGQHLLNDWKQAAQRITEH